MGGHLLMRTGRTGPGGRGVLPRGCSESPARPMGGPSSSENRAHRPGGDGESCPGGVRSLLPGQWGAIFFREPGAPARGGRGVLPRGCSEPPARAMGGHLLQRTGRTGLGGTGSPAQGVFGVSCKASGGPSSSENRAHRPGGDGESCPGGVRSLLPGPMGGHLLQRTGRTGPGGTGSPAQGVFEVSCKASGGQSSSENRAHRPGGDGEPCPGGVRSLLQCTASALGAVGSGNPAMHCHTAWGQWAVDLLQSTASLPGGSGQCNSCNTLPHCLGAAGSGPPAIHRLTAWGQWAVDLLQYTASLPGGSWQRNSCNALPHCLGAVGNATPAMHCLTAWGQ